MKLEEHPHGYLPSSLRIEGYEAEQVECRLFLLPGAGLTKATIVGASRQSPEVMPHYLTWEGHVQLRKMASRSP
jgi:hypothetical protein